MKRPDPELGKSNTADRAMDDCILAFAITAALICLLSVGACTAALTAGAPADPSKDTRQHLLREQA